MAEFIVTLPSGACFTARADENLLAAAQRAHWLVRYGCRNGNCEACAATLLKGRVLQAEQFIDASSSAANHIEQNILLCLCRAESDLQIALPGNPQHGSSEQARRYYARLNSCTEINSATSDNCVERGGHWRIQLTLPAGRQLPIYPGQYVLLEHNDVLIRAEIDTTASAGRELVLHSSYAPGLATGNYVTVICPLGYCYATALQKSVLIVCDSQQAQQAELLRKALPHAQLLEFTQLDRLAAGIAMGGSTFDTILACTQDQTLATAAYHRLLTQRIVFTEFRSDRAIWYRWRVWRQDDNNNRFMVTEAISEEAARQQVTELTARGHKQTYWAEPMALGL